MGGSGGMPSMGGSGGMPSTGGSGGATTAAGVDIYLLFDQTNSMSCGATGGTRWQYAVASLRDFLTSPPFSDLGVGLAFWGISVAAIPSCTPADYATPSVEIGPLPANLQALSQSLDATGPSSVTVPGPALQGGIDHAKAWATAHPSRKVIVVMIADGMIQNACTTIDPVAVATQGKAGTPSIPTYVIALLDSAAADCPLDPNRPVPSDFDPVAQAGGTVSSTVVDISNAGPQGFAYAFATILARAMR
jgi:hypothetical protein